MVVLKLDFEKAFDKIEHQVILDILKYKGFGDRRCRWIHIILSTGTSVLLNGVPRKAFHCRRGVRQGDPLSPLLFVLTADLLQTVNQSMQVGLLHRPIPLQSCLDFPIVQYADDTLVIGPADASQLDHLHSLLQDFATSTGLKVNFHKSQLIPINVDDSRIAALTNALHCQLGQLPFTYLGLPLGLTKPKIQDFFPMIQRVEKRFACCSNLLTYSTRLQMVNSVLSSLPTFFMCTFLIPKGVIEQLDKYRRHLLWRGQDLIKKNPPLVAWDLVCRPKQEGGLGVIALEKHNIALILKNLQKFYNHSDVPWAHLIWELYYASGPPHSAQTESSFWWRDTIRLFGIYKDLATGTIKGGTSALFWLDNWTSPMLSLHMPQLHSFANSANASVCQILDKDDFSDSFYLPLSQEAYVQFLTLQQHLQELDLTPDHDNWTYTWGTSYDTSKV